MGELQVKMESNTAKFRGDSLSSCKSLGESWPPSTGKNLTEMDRRQGGGEEC